MFLKTFILLLSAAQASRATTIRASCCAECHGTAVREFIFSRRACRKINSFASFLPAKRNQDRALRHHRLTRLPHQLTQRPIPAPLEGRLRFAFGCCGGSDCGTAYFD